jgi:hypothetical protein
VLPPVPEGPLPAVPLMLASGGPGRFALSSPVHAATARAKKTTNWDERSGWTAMRGRNVREKRGECKAKTTGPVVLLGAAFGPPPVVLLGAAFGPPPAAQPSGSRVLRGVQDGGRLLPEPLLDAVGDDVKAGNHEEAQEGREREPAEHGDGHRASRLGACSEP